MNARSFATRASRAALDALFPPRCAGCATWCGAGWHEFPFCDFCETRLRSVSAPLCARCGQPLAEQLSTAEALRDQPLESAATSCGNCESLPWPSALQAARAVGKFEGVLREAIHAFKYNGKTALAPGLGAMMARWCAASDNALPMERISLIVPVPMHAWRRWRRGFNQSELLARELALHLSRPCADVLRRARYTVPQVTLQGDARRQNVSGAIALHSQSSRWQKTWQNGAVLLIDDVMTTGATLCECAHVLQNAGAREVYALSLSRVE